jgi:protein tyrosine phosphatase
VNQQQLKCESLAATGPMIIHRSAGCGRTGAFCTIDTVISRLKNKHYLKDEERLGELDLIYQTVSKFREQRTSMVQTFKAICNLLRGYSVVDAGLSGDFFVTIKLAQ